MARSAVVFFSAASLLLHGLIALAIYFASDKVFDKAPLKLEPPDQPIEIVFQNEPQTTRSTSVQATNASQTNTRPPAKSFARSVENRRDVFSGSFRVQTLSKLAVGEQSTAVGNDVNKNATTGHGWSAAVQFGNAMDLEQTFASLPFFMALHAKVDSSLVYPDDFSRQRLTGKVRVEAELNPDGSLIRFVGSVSQDKILQTYCLAFLMQTLRQPLPKRAWADKAQVVAFEFDFQTHIPGEPQRLFPTVIQKNRLAFGRDNQIEPWVTERLNEIFTHYIPPIIPLPGGVYIDFVLAYQFIENLIESAPTERELRQGRIESLHLHLKDFLRHSTSPTPQPERSASPES